MVAKGALDMKLSTDKLAEYDFTTIPYTKRNKAQLNDCRGIKTIFVKPNYILDDSEKNVWGINVEKAID